MNFYWDNREDVEIIMIVLFLVLLAPHTHVVILVGSISELRTTGHRVNYETTLNVIYVSALDDIRFLFICKITNDFLIYKITKQRHNPLTRLIKFQIKSHL